NLNRWMGAKRLVLYGAIINVLGTFATPTVASYLGAIPMVILRFVMGFGQGLLWPCMSVLVGHWFPPTEKSTALAIATTGNQGYMSHFRETPRSAASRFKGR
ncbi:hypothetical protein TELCIR_24617, partial [Teladorsagia circumcincta]